MIGPVDIRPDHVIVAGEPCEITYTHRLGVFVGWVHHPSGTVTAGHACDTKAAAKTSAWWRAIRVANAGRPPP